MGVLYKKIRSEFKIQQKGLDYAITGYKSNPTLEILELVKKELSKESIPILDKMFFVQNDNTW